MNFGSSNVKNVESIEKNVTKKSGKQERPAGGKSMSF